MREEELAEITVEIKHFTSNAVLVWDGGEEVWLPLSQIVEDVDSDMIGLCVDLVIPEWLAEDKGLI